MTTQFLTERLNGALSYDRIAGYFRSSILETAGEALEKVQGAVRVVCNSDLNMRDLKTAKAAQQAMRQEWCSGEPEKLPESSKSRFSRLYEFLRSGKMRVKVLPKEKFGLIHGKAGVITLSEGNKTSFIGSTNETHEAWNLNYEIVWEDDSEEAVKWVQEEFDALWESPFAVELADFVIEDIGRLARRTVIPSIETWNETPEPAAPLVETPVYRKEYGLWEHQKYFVKLAFDAHKGPHGARFVLADTVGLGKTVQLAMSAMLMSLNGSLPVLIIAPKTLLWQWQDEMAKLLDMPSAIWTGKQWIDETGIEYPVYGPEGIKKCPRRVGIISQGLISHKSEAADFLKYLKYDCVIVDEAHRARRKNLGPHKDNEKPDPNNLLSFLYEISPRTKSLLLATATPVQMYPIEAWDLLNALSSGNDSVLGNEWSPWRNAPKAIEVVMGNKSLPDDNLELWEWVRNPLPPASEGRDFHILRRSLRMQESDTVSSGSHWNNLGEPDKARIYRLSHDFAQNHNPFIRHIVRRTRDYLENTIDPSTGEPFLKPVKVQLFGEDDNEAITLPPYLRDAYTVAEEFCKLFSSRVRGSGFLKTLLLRRVGSTIYAGRKTAESMLGAWQDLPEEEEEEEVISSDSFKSLTSVEREILEKFVDALDANQENDPKFYEVVNLLFEKKWLEEGCIIFSQYFDSIWWLADQLSDIIPEPIGIYAGGSRSGVISRGAFKSTARDDLKNKIKKGEIRLLLGTDAASEGLNLQMLGTLINLDLPWNPTRLEQRKGRIQRIGQMRDVVSIYNMRYKGSIEDRVHQMLSARLEGIHTLFGQLPDILEDVWIDVALGEIDQAKKTIDAIPEKHPFEIRYHEIEKIDWESCATVLDATARKQSLLKGW